MSYYKVVTIEKYKKEQSKQILKTMEQKRQSTLNQVMDYFTEKYGCASIPSFSAFIPAIALARQCYQQKQSYEEGFSEPRRFEIKREHLLGYPEHRTRVLDLLKENAQVLTARFYGLHDSQIDVKKVELMTRGSSSPLSLEIAIHNGEARTIRKVCYVKPFDINRLIGIEIYSQLSGAVQDYQFVATRDTIVEDGVYGNHEFEYEPNELMRIKGSELYRAGKINLDVLSFLMGLDDTAKLDNFVVSPEGRIRVVDFDVLDRDYTPDEQAYIRDLTAHELGISKVQYDDIYRMQEAFITQNMLRHRESITRLATIMRVSSIPELKQAGMRICASIENLIKA